MDELMRREIHEALSVETPPGLRGRVIDALPMKNRRETRAGKRSFEWVAGFAALLITIAVIAGLLYARGAQGLRQDSPGNLRPAPSARFLGPNAFAVASNGSIYISDWVSGYVFRLQPDGTLVTVAGRKEAATSEEGSAGDGGPALGAYLFAPAGIAFDQAGNLFIADMAGNRIRRVDTFGIITTIAGTGPALLGVGTFAGDGGPATTARLRSPDGIAFDRAGDLYFADSGNGKVRRIDKNGIISSLDMSAWPGSSSFTPHVLAFDSSGNLYVTSDNQWNVSSCWVVRITPQNAISAVAGVGTCGYSGDGGSATSAELDGVSGIALDSQGNLYIADGNNHRIRRVDANGIITTVAGTGADGTAGEGGPVLRAQLQLPLGLTLTSKGLLYIAEVCGKCLGTDLIPGRVLVMSPVDGTLRAAVSGRPRIMAPR